MQLLRSKCETEGAKTSREVSGLAGWVLGLLRRFRSECKPEIRQMHLLETLSLGGKRQLMLVTCGGEYFLVGGGAESLETIVRVRGEEPQVDLPRKLSETCY
jgi:flagellar biogenesis protein FliO